MSTPITGEQFVLYFTIICYLIYNFNTLIWWTDDLFPTTKEKEQRKVGPYDSLSKHLGRTIQRHACAAWAMSTAVRSTLT